MIVPWISGTQTNSPITVSLRPTPVKEKLALTVALQGTLGDIFSILVDGYVRPDIRAYPPSNDELMAHAIRPVEPICAKGFHDEQLLPRSEYGFVLTFGVGEGGLDVVDGDFVIGVIDEHYLLIERVC